MMKKMLFACLILTGICSGSAWAATTDGQEDICATAAVLMCDNFESRAVGNSDLARALYKNNGWALSTFSANGPRVISDPTGVYTGSHALQMTYAEGQNTGNGFMDLSWKGSARTIYYRWYTKFSSNFKWSYVATKHNEIMTGNGHTHHLAWFSSGGGASKAPANSFGYAGFYPKQNVNGVLTVVPDKWYCHEMRVTMNSTGGMPDGYLQGWIDGVQHWEYPNVNLDNTTPGAITGTLVSGYWNCYSGGSGSDACTDPVNDYHPLMYRWHDNLVVSTAPIGCLGAPASTDSTPPTPPANLKISGLLDWLLSLSRS